MAGDRVKFILLYSLLMFRVIPIKMCSYARVSVTTTPSNAEINSDNYDGGDKELW